MAGAVSAFDLAPEEAIAFLREKVGVPSEDWTTIWREANRKAFTVAGSTSAALSNDMLQAVLKAAETGTTQRAFLGDFNVLVEKYGWQHTGKPGWRAQIIYETNLSMAYSAGRYVQQIEPETLAAFPFWQYVHGGSKHPRHDHLSWDGLILRADDAWWRTHYPPNGWRCSCFIRVVSARDLARMGRNGPDTAPKIEYRDWVNRKTGEVHQVPKGIDPGFDYNPGMEWKGAAKVPDYATLAPKTIVTTGAEPVLPTLDWLKGGKASPPPPSKPSPPPQPPLPAAPAAAAVSPQQIAALDRTLQADFKDWADGLTALEADILAGYKGDAYEAMNQALREKLDYEDWRPINRRLEDALSRAKTKRAVTVFRGAADGSPLRDAKLGEIVTDDGFLSTSLDPDTARRFGGHPPVVVEIRVPKGYVGGAYVHHAPVVQLEEYEFLFRPGSPFKVVEEGEDRIVLEPVRGKRSRASAAPKPPRGP